MPRPRKRVKDMQLTSMPGEKPKRRLYEKDQPELPGMPSPPATLSPEASKVWDEVIPDLMRIPGLMSTLDWALLADFCEIHVDKDAYQKAKFAELKAARKAAKQPGSKPYQVLAGEIIAKYGPQLRAMIQREGALRRELGMSPSGRNQIKIDPSDIIQPTEVESAASDVDVDDIFAGLGGDMVRM
jgi:phage terminase small subunit